MQYLYGIRTDQKKRLVATFDSEPQLLAYANWATLKTVSEKVRKFEQGSALAGCESFDFSDAPLTREPSTDVPHNPSPGML